MNDEYNNRLLVMALIVMLIGGFAIGFLSGQSYKHKQWVEYYDEYTEKIESECVCISQNLEHYSNVDRGFNYTVS